MTFEEARKKYLEQLGNHFATLYKMMSDKDLCNSNFKGLITERDGVLQTIKDIINLNNIQAEVERIK